MMMTTPFLVLALAAATAPAPLPAPSTRMAAERPALVSATGHATLRLLKAEVVRWDSLDDDDRLPTVRTSQISLPDGTTADAQLVEFQ